MIKIVIRASAAILGLSVLLFLARNAGQIGNGPLRPFPGLPAATPTLVTTGEAAPTTGATAPRGDATSSTLQLSPIPAKQGGSIRIAGRGYAPGEMVLVQASTKGDGEATLDLSEAQADQQGEVLIPSQRLPEQLTSGSHLVEAVGEASGKRTQGTLYVRAKATWINLGKLEVSPGEKLGFIAGGFEPNERLHVMLAVRQDSPAHASGPRSSPSGTPATTPSGTSPATPVSARQPTSSRPVDLATLGTDRVGNSAWAEVSTDHVKRGAYTLVVRGESSRLEIRRDVTLKPYHPSVELSPWYGLPGTKLQLNVKGLAPGEAVHVFVAFDSHEAGRAVADQYGNLWGAGPVKVPYDASPGPLAVTIIGDESRAPTTVQYKVGQAKPWLELTNWWGPPGAPVAFTGGGWDGGEDVTVHVGSELGPVVATGQADEYGWLRGSSVAYVPRGATTNVTFVAVGKQSYTTAAATFKLVYPYGIKPLP